ncbi:rhodanese-like domain-containing protein [Ramlibacter sp. AN1015]|uniref:rhodanese-like domain-containing protein n=1 Tax=Ramlibacter sp. AN1015 TaxID=3133428 RepID=UPI0030BAB24D
MNFLIDNWALISVALLSGGMLLWPMLRGGSGGGLNPAAAVQLINRERGVVVDVAEPDEYAAGHVAGARNVPLGQFEKRLPEVVKNKTVPLILVCPTGARAQRALPTAKRLGYEKAQVLAGGLRAWKEANLPVEKA